MTGWYRAAVCAAALLTAVAAPAMDVSFEYSTKADFSRFKTYVWMNGTPAADSFTEERIRRAVDAQLRRKGLTLVETGADLWVVSHASVKDDARLEVNNYAYGGYYVYRGISGPPTGSVTATVRQVPVGGLLVDLVDTESKRLVWRATASAILKDYGNPQKSRKRIEKATARMFKKYPPKVEKASR
jgi:hypothetical protein